MADREKGKNMRISVAMATYNGARFITEQLDSIRLQSLPVDQVILRDDGSSDQTLEIVREYLETYELAPEDHTERKTTGVCGEFPGSGGRDGR